MARVNDTVPPPNVSSPRKPAKTNALPVSRPPPVFGAMGMFGPTPTPGVPGAPGVPGFQQPPVPGPVHGRSADGADTHAASASDRIRASADADGHAYGRDAAGTWDDASAAPRLWASDGNEHGDGDAWTRNDATTTTRIRWARWYADGWYASSPSWVWRSDGYGTSTAWTISARILAVRCQVDVSLVAKNHNV